jgi:hypothetical protein
MSGIKKRELKILRCLAFERGKGCPKFRVNKSIFCKEHENFCEKCRRVEKINDLFCEYCSIVDTFEYIMEAGQF